MAGQDAKYDFTNAYVLGDDWVGIFELIIKIGT